MNLYVPALSRGRAGTWSKLLGMEEKRMSVGFADLAHYDKAVQALGSRAAVELLERAFLFAGDAIVGNGGRIRKYIGDAILFTFDDATAAVRAGEAIARFWEEVGGFIVEYHVGIATGDVLVCTIGHPSHRAEDVMGQTVNRAARLSSEAHRHPDGLALCEETARFRTAPTGT